MGLDQPIRTISAQEILLVWRLTCVVNWPNQIKGKDYYFMVRGAVTFLLNVNKEMNNCICQWKPVIRKGMSCRVKQTLWTVEWGERKNLGLR